MKEKTAEQRAGEVIAMLLIMLAATAICAACMRYSLNAWLAYAGKDTVVAWWQCGLVAFTLMFLRITRRVAFLACLGGAVATWIAMMFLR